MPLMVSQRHNPPSIYPKLQNFDYTSKHEQGKFFYAGVKILSAGMREPELICKSLVLIY